MHVYQRNFSTRTLLQHKLHQLSAKKKKRNTHIPAAIMQVLRISTREKPDETKPFPNHIARIRSSVAETTTLPGNRGRIGTQRPHLAAGEEELLAAVVPPGEDLPAVQAHLQNTHHDEENKAIRIAPNQTKGLNAKPIKIHSQKPAHPRVGAPRRAEHDLVDAVPVPDHLQLRPRIRQVGVVPHAHQQPASQPA